MTNFGKGRGRSGIARRTVLYGAALFIALAVSAAPALAVVIRTGDGTGNTSAPPDDPGWLNVGKLNAATGIYLGSRWVLTANHVGAGGNIILDGSTYSSTGASLQLKETNLSNFTDLRLFRINAAPPGLPDLSISASAPPNGADLTMIGYGYTRDVSDTYWDVDKSTNPWVWTPLGSPAGAEAHGYDASLPGVKRWGKNDLLGKVTINLGTSGIVETLETDFDASGGQTDEAQAVAGDSGGAAFYKNGGSWELAGLMGWVSFPSTLQSATDDVGASAGTRPVFGSFTFAANLSKYKSQIEPYLNPTLGDMNADGVVNDLDVPWFVTALVNPNAYFSQFFFADSSEDLIRYGDVDGSGTFDLGDLAPFSTLVAGSASATAGAVPEPTALSLLTAGLLSLWGFARRNRRAK